jgi:hypothetical protein
LTLGTHRRYAPIRKLERKERYWRITQRLPARNRRVAGASSESGSQLDFRFPRFKRKGLEDRRFSLLASQLIPGKPLPDDLAHRKVEAISVSDRVIASSAIVKLEFLLVQVTKQMERFYAHIGSVDATLEEAPKIFQAVRVHIPANVFDCMIYDLMRVFRLKAIV